MVKIWWHGLHQVQEDVIAMEILMHIWAVVRFQIQPVLLLISKLLPYAFSKISSYENRADFHTAIVKFASGLQRIG